jgi:phytoene dehydrogenase-like protein
MQTNHRATVVVGGGVTGLAVAALCARRGERVVLFEKARELGGRAGTRVEAGYRFNYGAHALYLGGAGPSVLQEIEVPFHGPSPVLRSARGLRNGVLHALPLRTGDLLATSLLDVPGKIGFARILGGFALGTGDPDPKLSLDQWLAENLRSTVARDLFRAFVRLSTFHNLPDRMSAARAVAQFRLAMAGVSYLDGGWQTLVDGLRNAAEREGVQIRTCARVAALDHDDRVRGVVLDDGTRVAARTVIVAASPSIASSLTGDRVPSLRKCTTQGEVRAACLDLGLERLPHPETTFVLGIDEPLYFSVHTASGADLAPPGGSLVSTLEYLDPDVEIDAESIETRLEHLLDLAQPGWRAHVVARQFLPHMTVMHVPARLGRPLLPKDGSVPAIEGLFVAGDWVAADSMLLDACLASARRVAAAAVRRASAPAMLPLGPH